MRYIRICISINHRHRLSVFRLAVHVSVSPRPVMACRIDVTWQKNGLWMRAGMEGGDGWFSLMWFLITPRFSVPFLMQCTHVMPPGSLPTSLFRPPPLHLEILTLSLGLLAYLLGLPRWAVSI